MDRRRLKHGNKISLKKVQQQPPQRSQDEYILQIRFESSSDTRQTPVTPALALEDESTCSVRDRLCFVEDKWLWISRSPRILPPPALRYGSAFAVHVIV